MRLSFVREYQQKKTDPVWGKYPERKDRISELCKKIKPTVRFSRIIGFLLRPSQFGSLYHIDPVDPFNVAYTLEPQPNSKAKRLEKICDITTYHAFGYYGLFKPSIAEVIAQIPEKHLGRTVAFEIVVWPETREDLSEQWDVVNEGYLGGPRISY